MGMQLGLFIEILADAFFLFSLNTFTLSKFWTYNQCHIYLFNNKIKFHYMKEQLMFII